MKKIYLFLLSLAVAVSMLTAAPLAANADESWGRQVQVDGQVFFVGGDGSFSAEINGNNITWLRESTLGTTAWYGIDNAGGTFENGSRFRVKPLCERMGSYEYQACYGMLDDEHRQAVEENRLIIFQTDVTSPSGYEYTDLPSNTVLYVEISNDWDEDDIRAVYIGADDDEVLDVEVDYGIHFLTTYNAILPDESARYARLVLSHFSPYAIYDAAEEEAPDGVAAAPPQVASNAPAQAESTAAESSDKKSPNTGAAVGEKAIAAGFVLALAMLVAYKKK